MKQFLRSFVFAFNGILHCARKERNFIIHLFMTVLVLMAAWIFHLSNIEWMILLLNIALVVGFEMMNSAIERICNFVQPQHNHFIKLIKDISAGAVLVAASTAVSCGLLIFLPKIL